MDQSNFAVLDAATAHGAARWLKGVHQDPNSPYRQQYKAIEDRMLFGEFLHDVLLYDKIVLDDTNGGIPIVEDVIKLFASINMQLGSDLLTRRSIAPTSTYRPVMEAVCQLLVEKSADEAARKTILSTRFLGHTKILTMLTETSSNKPRRNSDCHLNSSHSPYSFTADCATPGSPTISSRLTSGLPSIWLLQGACAPSDPSCQRRI
jgi:hypothetical protein